MSSSILLPRRLPDRISTSDVSRAPSMAMEGSRAHSREILSDLQAFDVRFAPRFNVTGHHDKLGSFCPCPVVVHGPWDQNPISYQSSRDKASVVTALTAAGDTPMSSPNKKGPKDANRKQAPVETQSTVGGSSIP